MQNEKKIKCIVWDLDNTLWNGILLEETDVRLKENIKNIISELDNQGILHSIASKNVYQTAKDKLLELGIWEYFLYPQISWNSKSISIKNIAQSLNINVDTILFVDDDEYELSEIKYAIPEVTCFDAKQELSQLLKMDRLIPKYITQDSKNRRTMYIDDRKRKEEEANFTGPQEEYLASLNMVFTISEASEEELERVRELTERTNQLNTTGYTYTYEELDAFRCSKEYKLYVASLEDKFGDYGTIGVALVKCEDSAWTIKLLLMSCRVMSRGVGTIFINYIINMAAKENKDIYAEFTTTDKNRIMLITYTITGFRTIKTDGNHLLLQNAARLDQKSPEYIKIKIGGEDYI